MPKTINIRQPRFFVNPYGIPSGRDIGPPPILPNMHRPGQLPKYLNKLKMR